MSDQPARPFFVTGPDVEPVPLRRESPSRGLMVRLVSKVLRRVRNFNLSCAERRWRRLHG